MTAQPVEDHVMWSPDPRSQLLVADSAERLSLTLPFPIELDIRDVTP